ncbi:hypothetical protein FLM9_892 [Candidatus Synechococcus spongiarum]|uniref:Uncharacterized protein n=1 Tax=Candidatus Synechococcus spongiarum TaxID=431041 RepID=A0A171DGL8_9SYNE|nr:hypothetical protein FLM9_892 [Candidatus Synechococcus spongiarum]
MPTWLLPSLPTGGLTPLLVTLGAIWAEIKASEARQNKRIDELRSDLKDGLGKLEAKVDHLIERHVGTTS